MTINGVKDKAYENYWKLNAKKMIESIFLHLLDQVKRELQI